MSILYFLRNSWHTGFTKFHPILLGNLVLCSGSNTLFGFWIIKNPTLGTCSPKNSMSNSMYLDNDMAPLLALFRSNMWSLSATAPSAGPSCSVKYLLKWSYHTKLTILPESSSKGTDSPIIFSLDTGALGYHPFHYFKLSFHGFFFYFCMWPYLFSV